MWTGTVAEIARTATDFIHVDEIGGRQGRGLDPEAAEAANRTRQPDVTIPNATRSCRLKPHHSGREVSTSSS
jgi:hypothetical protein